MVKLVFDLSPEEIAIVAQTGIHELIAQEAHKKRIARAQKKLAKRLLSLENPDTPILN